MFPLKATKIYSHNVVDEPKLGMSRLWLTAFCTVLFLLLGAISVQPIVAQDYKALREQLKQRQQNTRNEIDDLKARIAQAERDLLQTDRKYDRVYKEYRSLAREIRLRDALITKLQDERKNLLEEISLLQKDYSLTEDNLQKLQENYKKTLTYLYKRGRVNDVAIILSSVSINQMLIRAKYLQLFDLHLRKLEDQIKVKQQELKDKERQLELAKANNLENEQEIQAEKLELSVRRNTQEANIETLKSDRQKTQTKLSQLENEIESFKQTLSSLIENEEEVRKKLAEQYARLELERIRKLREAEEMEASEERERLVEKYSAPTPKTNVIETIDFGPLEQSFAQQKGKLKAPVENGVVVGAKGIRSDPLYSTKIDYPGIDIAAKANSPVRVVHDGLVFRTIPMTGYGDVVFVKHGRFITAYGNLSKIQVQENSFVRAGEIIGLSGDKDSTKGEILFFMIRESNTYLNPEDWIKSR
jgi:septal ring factor EnvC (AmiA/AmiB activator)